VTLAYLTNTEGAVAILIVFPAIAATVIFVRLRTRARQRDSQTQAEPTLLDRIEAMSNEEYEAWRDEGRRVYQENKVRQREGQRRRRQRGV
jgi:uncharacterized membrane protein